MNSLLLISPRKSFPLHSYDPTSMLLPSGLLPTTKAKLENLQISLGIFSALQKMDEESTSILSDDRYNIYSLDWTLPKSVDGIAQELFKTDQTSLAQKISVIKLLCKHYIDFAPAPRNELGPCFVKRQGDLAEFYGQMIKNPKSPDFIAFMEKCKEVLCLHRSGRKHTIVFDAKDKRFFQVMKTASTSLRKFPSPEQTIAFNIIQEFKKMYPKESISVPSFVKIFKELGLWAPWQSSYVLSSDFSTISTPLCSSDTTLQVRDDCDGIRRDFGEMPVYMIDAENAKELDDGISLEESNENGDWIHIHIADPTRYLLPSDPMAREAMERVSSCYLVEKTFPMFPANQVQHVFDVRASKCAMTFSAKLDSNGDILDYKVCPSIIKNVRKTTYDTVDAVLDWSNLEEDYQRDPWMADFVNKFILSKRTQKVKSSLSPTDGRNLKKLQELAKRHLEYRVSKGAFSSNFPYSALEVHPSPLEISKEDYQTHYYEKESYPWITLTPFSQTSPTRSLVSECMVIAGRVAAMFCRHHQVPAVFKGLDMLDVSCAKFQNVMNVRNPKTGTIPAFQFHQHVMPQMKSTYEHVAPLTHMVMGLLADTNHPTDCGYLRVTSPLRRFSDMIAHWNIKSVLAKKSEFPFSESDILNWIPLMRHKSAMMMRLERSSTQFWKMEWARRREYWVKQESKKWMEQRSLPPDVYTTIFPNYLDLGFKNKIIYEGILWSCNALESKWNVYLPEFALAVPTVRMNDTQFSKCALGQRVRVQILNLDSRSEKMTVVPVFE